MADDDEIDVLGDFSFNSCLAQNNQGIPSCSSREDTVHPQWLLDSTVANWYDNEREKRAKYGPSRKLSGDSRLKHQRVQHSSWSQAERDLLGKEMAKYGRDFHKISQTIKTKSAAEIQALIEAEYGVKLDDPSMGLMKNEEQDDIPSVGQEEIVTDDSSISNVLSLVTTASPTITVPKKPFRKKNNNVTHKSLKPLQKSDLIVNPSEIYYEDELIIGPTESVGSLEPKEDHTKLKTMAKQQKDKVKAVKKIGNHRRKVSKNFDKGRARTSSKELLKSPQERRRKDSGVSEESIKSLKLQIVLGSGQALHVSEGEQVIKIEKKKDSESDSDIEVDVDSDSEKPVKRAEINAESAEKDSGSMVSEVEAPIAVPLNKFGLPPKRQKKIVLDGGGGYTIAHTAAGDVLQRRREPRPARAPRPRPERLLPCRVYNAERPAPYSVVLSVSALLLMDAHAHGSRAEVMGLLGGRLRRGELQLRAYRAAAAAAGTTHCDMDPVSQAAAGAWLQARGLRVVGWHHSHPRFPPEPSALDLRQQAALQAVLEPFAALVTSQHWPAGRTASQYRCFRVEHPDAEETEPQGFQLRVRLQADVTAASAPGLLRGLRALLLRRPPDPHRVRVHTDVCPQAQLTYLEKCVSSMSHHLRAAGYAERAPEVALLTEGLRDICRSPNE
ncbi:uncharacterized protein LOC133521861 isoform X2 [Cydia pomonella]|uniref:uncharacterized protein LOC133521861 isoform X2 n=1 Tax=Cydia pomonella TaxID=82600 RepID=UPI002ADD89C8|nr:uncharacterized protein LOC133521861 isoform X2 [Cydia pomonella]